MPFVSGATIRQLARKIKSASRPVFYCDADGTVGFPFVAGVKALPVVTEQITERKFSLQKLAHQLDATTQPIPAACAWRWFNVNTPAEFEHARALSRTHARSIRSAAR